jgi:hypothetical protein
MRPIDVCITVMLGLASLLPAEDKPAAEVPPEGAWARYHGVTKPDNGPEVIYKSTIRVLGRADHQGQPCRWIEVEESYDEGSRQISQYLIPERALAESKRPLDEAVKAVSRDRDGKIVSESLDSLGFGGADMLFLAAARQGAEVVKAPQTVEYQAGKLTIPQGERGEYVWERKNVTMTSEYTVWTDPKVSLGLARKKIQLTRTVNGVVIRTWSQDQYLEDFGFDAKSEFPN